MRWAAFSLIDWMSGFQDKSLLTVKPRKLRDCVVLLEEVVGHHQIMLNTISFEPRVKNVLYFGRVERDKPI